MGCKKIIPCLDIYNGKTVKGINFENLKEAGDPVQLAAYYEHQQADELAILNIAATKENKADFFNLVEKIRNTTFFPLIVGGGINSVDDAKEAFSKGASKVSVNSSAVKNPQLIDDLVKEFGSDKVVCAIDAKKNSSLKGGWEVTTSGGKVSTKIDLFEWAKEVEERGCGSILLTSMNHDGTKGGFALKLLAELTNIVKIRVIASGGAGSMDDFVDLFEDTNCSSALAASIFHYGEVDVLKLKHYLDEKGIEVCLKK